MGRLTVVDEAQFQEQLDRLEREWRRVDASSCDWLRPGLSDEQIDEMMAPTGLTLPAELRLWWGWHDGSPAPDPGTYDFKQLGPGGWLHLPLSKAIDSYNYHEGSYRRNLEIGALDLAELAWRPGLFPFSHRGWKPNHVLAADTLVPAQAPAPVVMTTEMGIEQDAGANSLSEVVGLWIELLESGRYHVEDGSLQPLDWFYTEESRFLWLL